MYKHVHFVGIKGVGLTALALLVKDQGIGVSGSDVEEVFPTDQTLMRFGISYQVGFSPQHIPPQTDLVVYTGAHGGRSNVEVQEAQSRNIKTLPHGKALGEFMSLKRGISVAGSHGKTTTSALLSSVLTSLNQDPSFAVGCGEILNLKTSGHAGKGEWFVAEADEYVTDPHHDSTPRFMWQNPEILVITNIDFDHPDVYSNITAVKTAFLAFIQKLPASATVVLNRDDLPSCDLLPQIKARVVTYGKHKEAQFRLLATFYVDQQLQCTIQTPDHMEHTFHLQIPGEHNAYNALAALAALSVAGFGVSATLVHMSKFTGTKRRFEKIIHKNGKYLFDDYAHHPKEIQATLLAARQWFPKKRIVAIFQPHTYSRTQALLGDFARAFTVADAVVITEIYASARETSIPGFSARKLAEEAKKYHAGVIFAEDMAAVLKYVSSQIQPGDVVITMGAGAIYTWLPDIERVM